jgi:hypothetical protein
VAPDAPTAKSEEKPEVVPASNPIKDSTKTTTTTGKYFDLFHEIFFFNFSIFCLNSLYLTD